MKFPERLLNLDLILNGLREAGVKILEPENTWISPEVSIGKGTVVYPNSYIVGNANSSIGGNCQIGPNAYLREWFKIGDEVKIGLGAEIVRSSINDRTKIPHFCHVGDALIGRNCNIAAGVIFCNFDGENKNTIIIEDNVFIGSGANLIAPVRIGKHAYVGVGAIVSRDVNPYDLVIGVNKVVEGKKSYYGYGYEKPGWRIYPIEEHPVWKDRGGY